MTDKPVDAERHKTTHEDQSQYKTQTPSFNHTLAEDAAINGGPLTALRGADDDAAAERIRKD